MPVGATTGSGAAGTSALAKTTTSAISEQKDMFLQLLVAQLKNQDPSSPMDQKDMMAQMAQFTSVEQLTNLTKAMETLTFNSQFSQSVGLIGKTVDYAVTTGTDTTISTSKVTAVKTTAGELQLVLEDGTTITPANVVKVS